MKITEIFEKEKRTFSFEFFPPKNLKGAVQFGINAGQLMKLNPSFVTETCGAGGTTNDQTLDVVDLFNNKLKFTCVPHYTCVNATKEKVAYDMRTFTDRNIENVMLLRGDPPEGSKGPLPENPDGLNYASDLIKFVNENYGHFCIGAAAYPEKHPEAPSIAKDIENLKLKVDSGVDFLVTQMFFKNDYYYRFMDKVAKAGIKCRVIPGILPITDFRQIKRFAEISGAHIPDRLRKKMEAVLDRPDEVYKIGLDYAVEQSNDLLENDAPGLHFFTLNKSRSAVEIYKSLAEEYTDINKSYKGSFTPHVP